MRTTIDLPDAVFRELKSVAARRGTSLKEVVCKAVEREIRTAERKNGRRSFFLT
jgi:predicted DNA-binding ribbon-helix-helix protein